MPGQRQDEERQHHLFQDLDQTLCLKAHLIQICAFVSIDPPGLGGEKEGSHLTKEQSSLMFETTTKSCKLFKFILFRADKTWF